MIAGDIVDSRRPPVQRRDDTSLWILPFRLGARVRRRAAAAIAAAEGTPRLCLQRGGDPGALSAPSTTASAAIRTRLHYALKANSTLGDRARCCGSSGSAVDANSIWEIEVARRAGFPPADIVFTGVGKSAARARMRRAARSAKRSTSNRPASSTRIEAIAARLRPIGARRHSRQSRHRRQEPSAYLDWTEDQQVRRAGRRRARAARHRSAAAPSLQLVAIHVHVGSQITSSSRCAARRVRRDSLPRICSAAACRSNTSISAAASGFPTTARDVSSPADYVRALVEAVAADRAADRHRARPLDRRPGRRRWSRGSSISSRATRSASSRSSMPA